MILPPRGASVDTQRRSELRAALDPQEVIQRIDKLVDCDQVRLTDIFSDEDVHQLCDVLKIKCGIKSSRKSPFEGVCEVMDEEIITVKKPRNNKGRFTFEQFQMMPDEIQYRSIRYRITGRTEVITIVTTLVDSKQFSAEDIAEVYGLRWDVETDIACWKTTMGFCDLRCHTPENLDREIAVGVLAYNLVRSLMNDAAAVLEVHTREVSFSRSRDAWLSFSDEIETSRDLMWIILSATSRLVRDRPGREEPRALKNFHQSKYPKLKTPRPSRAKRITTEPVKQPSILP